MAGIEMLPLEQNDAVVGGLVVGWWVGWEVGIRWDSDEISTTNSDHQDALHFIATAEEFKWADFFGRHITKQPYCLIGVATLFLVAADITAFAAGAEGGEHSNRVERALLFASLSAEQGLALQHVEEAPADQKDAHLRVAGT
eukprot:Skav236020  [mRNA]  locus=scaffold1524:38775:40593:- [translate_table: standard]